MIPEPADHSGWVGWVQGWVADSRGLELETLSPNAPPRLGQPTTDEPSVCKSTMNRDALDLI